MRAKICILLCLFLFAAVVFAAEEKKADAAEKKRAEMKSKFKTWEEMTPEERKKIREKGGEFRDNMINMFNERLKHRYVPYVDSAALTPQAPGVGEEVRISVKTDQHKDAVDEVTAVEVFYTAPGGKFYDYRAQLEPAGGAWSATLPPFEEAGTVLYYIQIHDSYGSIYSELPCAVETWPPFDDPCMVAAAADPEPVDDEKINIEDNYDIWEIRVGSNDEYWFLQVNVEGKIYKGRLNPLKATMYMAAMMKTEKLEEISDITVFMGHDEKAREAAESQEGASVWLGYTPIGPMVHPDAPACWMGFAQMHEDRPDTENIECKKDGSDLFIKIKKEPLGKMLQDKVSLIGAMTGYVDSMEIPFPKIKDIAGFSRVEWRRRSFEVK